MVQPMVPKRRSSNLAKKSMKFREALCVSLIRPNNESYDGGSAVYEKQTNIEIEIFVKKLNKIVLGQTQFKSSKFKYLFRELKLPFGSTASSYEGGGPLETP